MCPHGQVHATVGHTAPTVREQRAKKAGPQLNHHGQVHTTVGHTASTVREQRAKKVGTQCTFFFSFSLRPLSHEMADLPSSTQSRNNLMDMAEIFKYAFIVILDIIYLRITGLTINMLLPKSQIQDPGHEVC